MSITGITCDAGLRAARAKYEWTRSTLMSYGQDGRVIASCKVDTLLTAYGTKPESKPKPAKPKNTERFGAKAVTGPAPNKNGNHKNARRVTA